MLKLARFLSAYKKECVIGPLFKFLEACFELVVPLITAVIIDKGIKTGDTACIARMGAVMVGLGVLGLACSLTAQYFAAKAAMGFGTEVRAALFRHISKLSYSEIDDIGMPTLITRLTEDVNQAQAGVNRLIRLFLRSPFIVVGALIMAFTVDVRTAFVFLAATPVIGLVIWLITAKVLPCYKTIQAVLDRVSLLTRENLTGVRVIRAFSKQSFERQRFSETCGDLCEKQRSAGQIAALLNPATSVIVNAAVIGIVFVGGLQVDAGRLSQGEVIALVNYMTQILIALIAFADLIVITTKAAASAERVAEVFALPTEPDETDKTETTKTEAPLLVFDDVSFAYKHSDVPALRDVSFSVPAGSTVGVIGGTGSGKSTLINLIARFYRPTKGKIALDGKDVRKYETEELRRKIGIVPQKAALFKGTVRDNLTWRNKNAKDDDLWTALSIAQGDSFIRSRKDGLDAVIEQNGRNLSGGQKQRLTIARALVGKPEILILDDSASALDYATEARLRKAVRGETKDMTVFIVSQRVAAVRNSDLILVLDDGKIAGIGRHEDLFENCPVYRDICLSQSNDKEAA